MAESVSAQGLTTDIDIGKCYHEVMKSNELMRKFQSFTSLYDLQSAFPTEKSCIKFLEFYNFCFIYFYTIFLACFL